MWRKVLLILSLVFAVASLIINTLAFVTPVGKLRRFGLVTVAPFADSNSTKRVYPPPVTPDGPRLWIGLLSSCARSNYSAPTICTRATISPNYNLSVISNDSAFTAATPSSGATALICFFLVLSILYCLSLAWSISGLWTENAKPLFKRYVNSAIGIASCIGGGVYVVLWIRFHQAIKNFNLDHKNGKPGLIASFGVSYTLVWVGYTVLGLSVLCIGLKEFREASKTKAKAKVEDVSGKE